MELNLAEVCRTSYEYNETVLATTTEICEKPLQYASWFLVEGIVVVLVTYAVLKFLK